MNELINDLNKASENISNEAKKNPETTKNSEAAINDQRESGSASEADIERKRKELLLLSSDGVIKKSVAYINKASAKVIEKLYAEHEAKRLDESAEFLCDLFLSKFAMVMDGLNAIEKPDEMEQELKGNPLLKEDIKKIAKYVTPFIPFLGVLSGGLTVGKHVWDKKSKEPSVDPKPEEE